MPVRITVDKFRQVSVICARASQVNAGGLAFFADTELEFGDEAEIAFTDHSLTVRAVVRNRTGNQLGMKFVATSAEETEHLALFRRMLASKMGRLEA